jgi:hypothetical protein
MHDRGAFLYSQNIPRGHSSGTGFPVRQMYPGGHCTQSLTWLAPLDARTVWFVQAMGMGVPRGQ